MNDLPLLCRPAALLALAALLSACSAAHFGAGLIPTPATTPTAPGAAYSSRPDSSQLTYSVSFYLNQIVGFLLSANGNATPSVVVSGSKTKLNQPDALAIDRSSGKLFVANGAYQDHRILIFPKGSNGNTAPQTLAGSNVPIQSTGGLAVDSSGNLYVSDYLAKAIFVFAAGASGNAAPIRTIAGTSTGFVQPYGMAFDSQGHLYVAQGHDDAAPIEEFAALAGGNVAPIATIGGSHTKLLGVTNVVLDKHDRIIVPNGGSIEVFAAGAHGNVSPAATIKGSNTTIADVTTVGTDSNGSIYGTNAINISQLKFSLIVFGSNANGNVAPARILSGSHTHIVDNVYPTTY
jgi:hypothetical protein